MPNQPIYVAVIGTIPIRYLQCPLTHWLSRRRRSRNTLPHSTLQPLLPTDCHPPLPQLQDSLQRGLCSPPHHIMAVLSAILDPESPLSTRHRILPLQGAGKM